MCLLSWLSVIFDSAGNGKSVANQLSVGSTHRKGWRLTTPGTRSLSRGPPEADLGLATRVLWQQAA